VDSFKFNPAEVIGHAFDRTLDADSEVWEEAEPSEHGSTKDRIKPRKFTLKAAVITSAHLLVLSAGNCYRFAKRAGKFRQKQCRVAPNLGWRSIFVSDAKYAYTIRSTETRTVRNEGIGFYNLPRLTDAKATLGKGYVDQTVRLKRLQVGIQSSIDFSPLSQRLCYFASYSEVQLIPTIHLNQVTLIGQKAFGAYLAVRQHEDCFSAISNEEVVETKRFVKKQTAGEPHRAAKTVTKLTSWDVVTGK